MKLRNKKTGEHGEYQVVSAGYLIRVRNCDTNESYQYDCIAGFNDNWEDYKPAEPLIKDEKIRKAVKAWAEAIGATRNIVFNGSWKICSFFYENNKGGFEKLLIYGDNDLEELKRYTITELCGEEGE